VSVQAPEPSVYENGINGNGLQGSERGETPDGVFMDGPGKKDNAPPWSVTGHNTKDSRLHGSPMTRASMRAAGVISSAMTNRGMTAWYALGPRLTFPPGRILKPPLGTGFSVNNSVHFSHCGRNFTPL
jgi:hypothetical protein